MKRLSVRNSIMLFGLAIILVSLTVINIIVFFNVRSMSEMAGESYKEAVIDGYKEEIKNEVQSMVTVLQMEYDKCQNGELTEEQAKEEAKEYIRNVRYGDGNKGYFWIDDSESNLVMHPILSEQEGTNRRDLKDKNGVAIMQTILDNVNGKDGAGYSEFYFTKEDGKTVAPKLAYSKIFKPWGWIVSTGNYTDTLQTGITKRKAQMRQAGQKILFLIIAVGILISIVTGFVSRLFANRFCKPLIKIQSLAERMGKGDLTTSVQVEEENELGETAGAVNVAQQQMIKLLPWKIILTE